MRQGRSRSSALIVVSGLIVVLLAVGAVAVYSLGAFDRATHDVSDARERGVEAIGAILEDHLDVELSKRYYAYSQLDDEDKRCYRTMFEALRTRARLAYPESDQAGLSHIRASVVADHPELFYADGVTLETSYNHSTGLVSACEIEGTYTRSTEEVAEAWPIIDRAVADFIASVPDSADAYEKAKLAYEYVIGNTVYDHEAIAAGALDENLEEPAPGQTMDDVFVRGRALCAGYSAAFQYLMQQMGYQCTQLRGTADGVGHAWCLLSIDGGYYLVDPTWGDPQFVDLGIEVDPSYVNYDYLCVTDADLAPTHVPDGDFAVPACTDTADNYFVREDLVFQEADMDRLGRLVSDAESGGQVAVQVRCADWDVYETLLNGFVASGDLGPYLADGEYRYLYSDEMRTISVCP